MSGRISIIGDGEMGQAVSFLLSGGSADCAVLGREHSSNDIAGSKIVFLCLNSRDLENEMSTNGHAIASAESVFCFTKGIMGANNLSPYEFLSAFIRPENLSVVGGPSIAEEILRGKPALFLVGSQNSLQADVFNDLLSSKPARAVYRDNPMALSWSGILKNIYAFGMGAFKSCGFGANADGAMADLALSEMRTLLGTLSQDFNLEKAEFSDFFATVLSQDSSNVRAGRDLLSGEGNFVESEGSLSARKIFSRVGRPVGCLFLDAIVRCLEKPKEAKIFLVEVLHSIK